MARLNYCVCGADGGAPFERARLPLLQCGCGVARRDGEIEPADLEQYRTGDYHRSVDRHPECTPYSDRYSHDVRVAARRWKRYRAVLPRLANVRTSLDVGCANGGFVDYLTTFEIDAWGIEPAPEFSKAKIVTGTLADLFGQHGLAHWGDVGAPLTVNGADLITYHDVLEHLPDPVLELRRARALLAPAGVLIVDVPDVWSSHGEHHFKPEHLWFFTADAVGTMMRGLGLGVAATDRPIPGKLVVYGTRS